ncbi:MAG: hypothetical protein J6A05_09870, partial [Oscillospiraceae bacterium]|nr:hypothetical protein [Oscillospiraceae bacterium]
MAKSKQRQSLHGAVLIMVLTVMVVLIIMLMATLTVVTTAGQRVYTKFEENQAYYTARSALDIFTESMLYDENYYANDGASTLKYSYTDKDPSTGTDKIFSKAVDLTQGQAIQGEIYKIKSQGVETKKLVDKIKKDTSHAVYDADLYNLVNTMTDDEAAAALGV